MTKAGDKLVNWNSGFNWNELGPADGGKGFFFNTDEWIILINVNELFRAKESSVEVLARLLVQEEFELFQQALVLDALLPINERLDIGNEDVRWFRLITITENLGIKDEFNDLLVLMYLNDDFRLLEETKLFVEHTIKENINVREINSLQAFHKIADELNLKDLKATVSALFTQHDNLAMQDGENPRVAVSDFLIGNIDDFDRAYDWIFPFNLRIDWGNSEMDVMPEAQLTKIEMPGIDGSIVEDSVYKDRIFKIVAYSPDGLTVVQREELKRKITQVLDATKHKDKKLTVQVASTSFDVRYEGQAEIQNGASYVKATIPLRSTPYGYDLFDHELLGAGLIVNQGDCPLRVRHELSGSLTNPSFSLGTITYTYKGTIPSGSKLIVDHEQMTAYIESTSGAKTNALMNLTGEFQAIPVDKSAVLNANSTVAAKLVTTWKNKVLW